MVSALHHKTLNHPRLSKFWLKWFTEKKDDVINEPSPRSCQCHWSQRSPWLPRLSPDVIGCDDDKWPVTTEPPETRPSLNFGEYSPEPEPHREIATDPARSWWGIFWNFKMTQSAMWCGHHHLSRIGASDISRDPGVFSVWPRWVFTMIWSIPGSIHTNITNYSITQQSQYNSLYLVILFSVRLCVVRLTMLRSAVCHIMPALYSVHLSWPGPLPTCSRVSITLASLIAPPGSAQPCHPPPPPRWHPENNVQCDHTADDTGSMLDCESK